MDNRSVLSGETFRKTPQRGLIWNFTDMIYSFESGIKNVILSAGKRNNGIGVENAPALLSIDGQLLDTTVGLTSGEYCATYLFALPVNKNRSIRFVCFFKKSLNMSTNFRFHGRRYRTNPSTMGLVVPEDTTRYAYFSP